MPRAAKQAAAAAIEAVDTKEDKENVDDDMDFDMGKRGRAGGARQAKSKAQAAAAMAVDSQTSDNDDSDAAPKTKKRKGTAAKPRPKKAAAAAGESTAGASAGAGAVGAGGYDAKACAALEKECPGPAALQPRASMIQAINADAPLALVPAEMQAPGCVYGMDLSADGQLLATVTTLGDIHIWDAADYTLLKTIRDTDEKNIDEYFVVRFTPDARCVYVAGKRKSRTRWDPRDDDNHVLPCHVKVFDVATGARVTQLVGHREEVLHIALVRCAGRNVALTGSQDGSIIAWEVSDDWRSVAQHKTLQDATSSMVFQLAPLPGTGCRYIVAAADSTLKVYDVVEGRKVAEFADLYTSFCDSVLVVDGDAAGVTTKGPKAGEWAVVTRGVEVVNDDDGLPSRDNTCALHILRAPTSAAKSKEWMLSEVRRYKDLRFHANSYLCRIASNGRYLCAPTVTGAVYVWNIATGAKVAVLQPAANASAAQGREIRDIAFHATRPHLLTCGDDGCVRVYQSADA